MRTRPVLAAALLLAGPAIAKTPDGLTPSVEDLCDQYEGRAFGLCNSYCEARDCDDPRVRAADASCAATERQFKQMTGRDLACSPEVPCTIVAEDDIRSDLSPSDFPLTISVLANDVVTDGEATIRDDSIGEDNLGFIEGLNSKQVGNNYVVSNVDFFTYNACCSVDTCDSAIVSATLKTS